ncbi:MAG: chemotaxis protein CheW [Candidatus Kapaibacteriales bacterium]
MKTFGFKQGRAVTSSNITKYVTFRIGPNVYCISVDYVQEMIVLPELMQMPNLPEYFNGVFELRNVVIPVMSLRKKFSMKTIEAENLELVELLRARRQEHIDWIGELERSVEENRPFRLTTDPRKCKFGLWYYNFKTDNVVFRTILDDFDEPHRKIHQIGIDVEEYKKNSQFDKARELIEQTRSSALRTMLELFDSTEKFLLQPQKKIGIVLRKDNFNLAIEVDKIISVSEVSFNLEDSDIRHIENARYAKRIGKEVKSKFITIEFDLDELLSEYIRNPITA